jgi:CheY-like chemotaxis protein
VALAAPPPLALLGDSPYAGDSDPLGFSNLAEDLAQLILGSRGATPFTLGVEASWGMGKSTLMGRLYARLEREEAVKPVWFNAWTADENGVLEGLLKTVLNEMDPNVLRSALRSHKLMGWLRVLVSIVAGFLRISNVVDEVWSRVAVDPRARNELRDLVEQAVLDWRDKQAGVPEDALLCVFVDDLDRCTPDGVLQVFEAMKLYMNVEGFVFIVGYDRDIVGDLVHQSKGYTDAIRSQDYLEKIIQTTFRIPRSSPEQSDALLERCLEGSGTRDLFGEAERALVIERNARNPRRMKRFLNGFVLSYGLDAQWREFRPETLIKVHLLYMYFKPFSDLLERRSERDPVEEFLEYYAARDVLRRRGGDWTKVEQAFQSHELTLAESVDPETLLAQLEENVPLPFKPLAAQDGFGTLVESLAAADDWASLRDQLAEGVARPADPEAGPTPRDSSDSLLQGVSVLWIDDQPTNNRDLADYLRGQGARVNEVEDTEQARAALKSERCDVVISDIARPGRRDAGLDDLRQLQAEGLAPDVAFFYTSRVTTARTAAAHALGADIVSGPTELISALREAVARSRQA